MNDQEYWKQRALAAEAQLEAAQGQEPVIDYTVLHQFAVQQSISYNKLCTAVHMCLAPAATTKHEAQSGELERAARQVLEFTEAAHRPPVRDKLEGGRMVMVRLHALADLHEALHPAQPKGEQATPEAMRLQAITQATHDAHSAAQKFIKASHDADK
ncbi:hypothetical protein [uncultured Rhodoferax sp.]|uniref:hypothetical protein n=1 Tax=uncultured Rhodoferax sp. TaxID=223188 RepID=UPI0025FAA6AA|nr:hypothetical protein [uncultured Rhodoferax sp.]